MKPTATLRSARHRQRTAAFFSTTGSSLCLALCSIAASSTAQGQFDAVRAGICREMVERSIPSIAVAVAQHGKIIWEQGFGWANRERLIPATENTMYSLASISKPITATGLMTLVQAGKIDLDKPVNDYLGKAKLRAWVGEASAATVRRVANHSSGLPEHVQFFYADEPFRRPSPDETILRFGNLIRTPGERFVYSNLGYGILGYVLSRVSAESYEDFMRERVFLKLGMTRTSVGVGPGLDKYAAIRYDGRGAPLPNYNLDTPGASEVYSSAHDLVRFGMFHLKDHLADQSSILSDASIDAMHEPAMHESDEQSGGAMSGYGIGWYSTLRPDGYRVVSHDGGMPGARTRLTLIPSEDIAVVLLTNSEADLRAFEDEIVKSLLPKWDASSQSRKANGVFSRSELPQDKLLGIWSGVLHAYSMDVPVLLKFLPSGDVHVKLKDEPEALLDQARFEDGILKGKWLGDPIDDSARQRKAFTLRMELKLRGDVLNGGMSAGNDGFGVTRSGIHVEQFVEFKKQEATGAAP